MRVHVVQHVAFEGPARLAALLRTAGGAPAVVQPLAGDPWPDLRQDDALVLLGGPMGLGDADAGQWLAPEAHLVERALELGVPLLGVCLGAQVIAHVLGARVRPVPEPEIGWYPVRRSAAADGAQLASGWPDEALVFHWHGDGFETPPQAVPLAGSEALPHQAFAVGERVLALQFHVETDRTAAATLVRHGERDLARAGRFVQSAGEILGRAQAFDELARGAGGILGPWLALLGGGRGR